MSDLKTYRYKATRRNQDHEPIIHMRFDAPPGVDDFKDRLMKALARYISSTERGQSMYKYAGQDLNIGDVVSHGVNNDPDFILELAKEKIFNFKVLEFEEVFSYDTSLAFYVDSGDE